MNSSYSPVIHRSAFPTFIFLFNKFALAVLAGLMLCISSNAAQPAAPVLAKGAIKQVGARSITINDKSDAVTVALGAATVVKVNGQVAQVADLKTGMSAIAFGEQGKPASEVRAYAPRPPSTTSPATQPSVYGNLAQIADGKITIEKRDKSSSVVTIDGATVVKVNGKAATPSDLKAGMVVIALGAADKPATEVRAYDQKPPLTTSAPGNHAITGNITQVGEGKITIQTKDQTSSSATFDGTTIVKVNGKVATAADLKVGMMAAVLGAADKPATEIQAYMPRPN